MRKSALVLFIFLCFIACISIVQADQPVPFAPLGNVTGNYTFAQGNDNWIVNTNFPVSSEDVIYPDWLFGMMIAFMVITVYFGLVFISKDPSPWVNVIACGVLIFGLGLSAAMMAPLVGYTQLFHQVVPGTPNTVYVNEIVVYTMGSWISYACYGIAIGGGLLFVITGLLLQMKATQAVTNQVQQEKIMGGEIDFRTREKRSR